MKRQSRLQVVPLTFLLTLVLTGPARAEDTAYTFSINGEPVTPVHYSLNADASVFAPGDVICVGEEQFGYRGLFLTLGKEKECRFITGPVRATDAKDAYWASRIPTSDGRLFLELPDGRRKLIGVVVTWTYRRQAIDPNGQMPGNDPAAQKHPPERIVINPLDSMSPEEIHGLWGICLNWWPEDIEQKLAHVNTDRVCIGVSDFIGVGGRTLPFGRPSFPRLPSRIRHLVVREEMSPGLSGLSHLSELRDLTFLIFESLHREPLDAGLLSQSVSLRYLDVSDCTIKNVQKLAALTELRFLNINRCRDIDSIGFVKDMRQLTALSMGWTEVTSLSPLDGSDSIREIYAGMTEVRDLPKGDFPSLRAVNLVSAKVDAQTVAQFRKAHPACKVEHGWAESLRSAVQGATRLRVRSGGTCHRIIEWEKTLVEITDAAEIKRFVSGISIDEARSGGACMCCGSPTFEFYGGERLLAMIGNHHEDRLRWADGPWTGDGELTDPSRYFILLWLGEHGVGGPRAARAAQQKQQAEERKIERRYAELIPQEMLVPLWDAQFSQELSESNDPRGEKRRKLMAEALQKHEKDAATSVELYLRLLGVRSSGSWNVRCEYDSTIIEHLLPRFKGPDLAQGAVLAMNNDEGAAGAAHWFFGQDGWRNLDPPDREKILPRLARRSLQHQASETRKKTMAVLMLIKSEWAVVLLRDMLSRPMEAQGTTAKRAGSGWRIDLGEGDLLWSGELSDAAWAAFCLAKMGDVESLPAIQKLANESQGQDEDLLNKALQLLRDNTRKAPGEEK